MMRMKAKMSKQPRKQRKARYNAPLHIRHKYMSALLSPDLRDKYEKRSFPLRKGDTVVVMRGDSRGKEGKVRTVDLKKEEITVEGVVISRSDLSEVPLPIHPSNVMITKIELKDKQRESALGR